MTSLDLEKFISQGMGQCSHWLPDGAPPSRIAEVLVGMANASGGRLLLGVSPRVGKLIGVADADETIDNVFQAALLSEPCLVLPLPRVHRQGDIEIIEVVVPEGLPHVYALEGRYLGRDGAQTNAIPARNLRRLLVERGTVHFESLVPPGASMHDLDSDAIEVYLARLDLPRGDPTEEILRRRGCLIFNAEHKIYAPTYAGLLLFGSETQSWMPGATILAARFSGNNFSEQYTKQDLHGTLGRQLDQAEAFLRDHLRSTVHLSGLQHEEITEYPYEAVRELLVNAVAHRDYNQQGDTIHLNIFSDRLEVHSPGVLPGPVTVDNLLQARFSRNPVIVQVLSDLGYVERLGYGLDRVVQSMRMNGLKPPRFEEVAGSFRVTLYARAPESGRRGAEVLDRYREMGLHPRQRVALEFLHANRRITNREYQEICSEVHPETLRRDLADLVSRGLLIKVGDKRATYYILKKA